jgi:ABC-type polysaccharide/polyol phosphate export permease
LVPVVGSSEAAAPEPPDATPSYLADFRDAATELWRFREMLYQLTLRDVRIRYKQAALGFGWALFMPTIIVIAGCLIRFYMVRSSTEALKLTTLAGLSVKALGWSFFVGTVSSATGSLTGNVQLVTKVYFPRAVLPLAATLAHAFDTIIGAAVLLVMLPFLGTHLSRALLWVPLLVLLLFVLTIAASLFLSCANLFYRDVKYIVQVFLTFGIFFTPVFFEPAMLGPELARLSMLNPLAPILEGLRLAIVEGHNLLAPLTSASGVVLWTPAYLVYAGVWAVVGLAASATLFHRSEFVFAEFA